jgi:protein-L-isoaspartate(D-aspartate) O-methyltransferase
MKKKALFASMTDIRPSNSNTRIIMPGSTGRAAAAPTSMQSVSSDNMGLTSERLRLRMVDRVRSQGVADETVLGALASVHRHLFVDQALASRAYEDAALPIGHAQTISQPWVVARMLAAVCETPPKPRKVLEVGPGCGYQAAVMSHVFGQVYSIERVRPLYDTAKERLRRLGCRNVHLLFGDGMLGWSAHAPFDAIVVAAAGLSIPQALLDQLAIGGRLIAPEGQAVQRLMIITRQGPQQWVRQALEAVRFVPLKPGVQS